MQLDGVEFSSFNLDLSRKKLEYSTFNLEFSGVNQDFFFEFSSFNLEISR